MESVALENKGAGEDSWDTTYFGGRVDAGACPLGDSCCGHVKQIFVVEKCY